MSAWPMPDSISPSRMSTFLQCPLRFRMETIQKLESGTNAAAVAGTTIHQALEWLFQLPAELRTPEVLEQQVESALAEAKQSEDYLSLTEEDLKGFDAKVRRVAPRAFDMVEPSEIDAEGVELRLEVDFEGWILRGIIDLAERRPDGLSVRDWKSGRAPSERFQGKAMLGLDFYSVMAEIHFGEIPAEVDLLYLDARVRIAKEPTARSVKAMKNKITAVRQAIDRACDSDGFKPAPSKLCDWCQCKPYCPSHGGDPDAVPVTLTKT